MFTKIAILTIAFLLLAPLSPVLGQEEAPPTNAEPAPEQPTDQPAEQGTDQTNTGTDSAAASPAGDEGQATDQTQTGSPEPEATPDQDNSQQTEPAPETTSESEPSAGAATQISEEAIEDQIVTEEDLDAKTPGTFHFVKRAVRAIQTAVTRDPVKKAELKLEAANEELLRIQKIAEENPDDEKTQAKAEKALEKFEKNMEKIKERTENIKEGRSEKADEFMEKMADMQIKQQKMLDNFQENLPPAVFAKIEEAKDKSAANFGEVMAGIENDPEKLAARFDQALRDQRGSQFKEFKNLEVLERVLGQVPPRAQEAIARVKAMAQARFEENLKSGDDPLAGNKFKEYVANISGEATEQMKVLDQIKSTADLPTEFFQQMEEAKVEAMTKFEENFRRFNNPQAREKLMGNLKNGDVEGLRVFRQIQENMPADIKDEIGQHESEAIVKFKEKFTSDTNAQVRAEKFRELSKQLRENPDPSTFAAIDKLREELPAEQRAFVDSLENQTKIGFEEKFQAEQGKFLERIKSFDPQAVGILNNLQVNSSPQLRGIINQAVNNQIDFVKERLENIQNPAQFERFKERIEDNEQIKNQIENRVGDFEAILENKEQEIQEQKGRIEQKFQERLQQINEKRGEDGAAQFSPEETENLKQRFMLQPQMESKMEMQKKFELELRQERKESRQQEGQQAENDGEGSERKFEPKQFEPGERGEIRRDEVRPDSFNQVREPVKQEIRQETRELRQNIRDLRQDARQEIKQEARQEIKEEIRENRAPDSVEQLRDFKTPTPAPTENSGGSSGGGQIFTPAPSSTNAPSPDAGSFSPAPVPSGEGGGGGTFTSPSSGDGGGESAPPPPPSQ